MKYLIPSAITLLSLSACASVIDGQSQKTTLRTPGADNAKCTLSNDDIRYVAYTDQQIEMMKTSKDLLVNCKAAGNRERTVLVKRGVTGWTILNVANGFVPGVTYDVLSKGAFAYPDEITISFENELVKAYPEPTYMADELQNNHRNGKIEYMGPNTLATEKSRYAETPELQKLPEEVYVEPEPVMAQPAPAPTRTFGENIDDIHRAYNPTVPYDPTEEDK